MIKILSLNKEVSISKEIEKIKSIDDALNIVSEYNSEIINKAPIGANIERKFLCHINDTETGLDVQLNIAVIIDSKEKEGDDTFSEIYIKSKETGILWFTGKNTGRRHCSPHYNTTCVFFLIKEEDYNKNWNSIPV